MAMREHPQRQPALAYAARGCGSSSAPFQQGSADGCKAKRQIELSGWGRESTKTLPFRSPFTRISSSLILNQATKLLGDAECRALFTLSFLHHYSSSVKKSVIAIRHALLFFGGQPAVTTGSNTLRCTFLDDSLISEQQNSKAKQ